MTSAITSERDKAEVSGSAVIFRELLAEIRRGNLKPGDLLPSEGEIMLIVNILMSIAALVPSVVIGLIGCFHKSKEPLQEL